jgi:hypothetical protein
MKHRIEEMQMQDKRRFKAALSNDYQLEFLHSEWTKLLSILNF